MSVRRPSPRQIAPAAEALRSLRRELRALADPQDAAFLQRFFKTGPGEYGEGDRFLGIRVPVLRRLAREYRHLPVSAALTLLRSSWHEERLLALLLLVQRYSRAEAPERERIYQAYLSHTRYIDNWDLVDASAPQILGAYLSGGDLEPLRELAASASVWERRMAILATFHFIRQRSCAPTLELAARLAQDEHDLIHKAVGWMLREVGKRDRAAEERFLRQHAPTMPRTMLRYAIEHFPETRRRQYLAAARAQMTRASRA